MEPLMSEPFLEEQLKRIREMSERISEVRSKIREIGGQTVPDRLSDEPVRSDDRPTPRHSPTPRRR